METLFIILLGWGTSLLLGKVLLRFFPLVSPSQVQQNQRFQRFFQYHIPLISAALLLAFHRGYLSLTELITLITGLYLLVYDCKHQAYPLLLWLISFAGSLFLTPPNGLTLTLLILAGFAQLGYIPIGTGDFLYLANASLILGFSHLLGTIQIACLTGLLAFVFRQEKKSIPFIPFIFLGLVLILIIKNLTYTL